VRFSKFDRFELLMSLSGKWFGRFSRISDRVRLGGIFSDGGLAELASANARQTPS